MEIDEVGPRRWRVRNRGELQTIRFDKADAIAVDHRESKGVLGENRHQGSLYVALDPAAGEPVVALKSAGAPAAAVAVAGNKGQAPARAHLIESRWRISGLSVTPCQVKAKASGFGPGEMVWGGLAPGRYRLAAGTRAGPVVLDNLIVGADGVLNAVLPSDARSGLALILECRK